VTCTHRTKLEGEWQDMYKHFLPVTLSSVLPTFWQGHV
jgi:hypothetical protein